MRRTTQTTILVTTLLAAIGCGGGNKPAETGGSGGTAGPDNKPVISGEAKKKFDDALQTFVAHDKANDWNESACGSVADDFQSAAKAQNDGKFAEALFDSGLAYQRCGLDDKAKERFQDALKADDKFSHARVQLALYAYKADSNEDNAINSLQQAVLDAQFQNVPALVNLAMFQMQRDAPSGAQDCKDDMECAKKNLQRALAIDDAYMPALNQLALYYFNQAKKKAGQIKKGGRQIATNAAIAKRADVQQLELAALVCSQAITKNPTYAPIRNTYGLIQNELGQINAAVANFKRAADLDPKFFEAQMNYAAVNLSFRGFDQAEKAYDKALQMRPNDYDAHLGRALALRGQINDANYDKQVAAVQAELDACKKISGDRPDAFYNEGILTQEYKAKSGGGKAATIAALDQASTIFQSFIDKASGKPEYDGAVKRAKERMEDIKGTKDFLNMEATPSPPPAAPPAAGAPPAGAPAAGGAGAPPAAGSAAPAAPGAPASPPK